MAKAVVVETRSKRYKEAAKKAVLDPVGVDKAIDVAQDLQSHQV